MNKIIIGLLLVAFTLSCSDNDKVIIEGQIAGFKGEVIKIELINNERAIIKTVMSDSTGLFSMAVVAPKEGKYTIEAIVPRPPRPTVSQPNVKKMKFSNLMILVGDLYLEKGERYFVNHSYNGDYQKTQFEVRSASVTHNKLLEIRRITRSVNARIDSLSARFTSMSNSALNKNNFKGYKLYGDSAIITQNSRTSLIYDAFKKFIIANPNSIISPMLISSQEDLGRYKQFY
ncbi:MAG: carboxypeptidase regulatory-like domain-containing protein, partial [Sphingobacteriales bacterium]